MLSNYYRRYSLIVDPSTFLHGVSVLTFCSNKPTKQTRVGNVVESKTTYRYMIPDATGPEKNKNYESRSLVTSHISMLGRVFDESVVKQTLVVQYPVKLTNIQATTWLGPNEVTTLTYTITNISAKRMISIALFL
jgi:hypothetical protein